MPALPPPIRLLAAPILAALCWLPACATENQSGETNRHSADLTVRIATFNVALNRATAGALGTELAAGSAQARAVAEIIQRVRPDVLLLNEFDYDAKNQALSLFLERYLGIAQNGARPIDYPFRFTAPVNTGEPSGVDLDGDGKTDGPGDAKGYGAFPGQYGMALLSRHRIDLDRVRTFRKLLWRDLARAALPDDLTTPKVSGDWYDEQALAVLPLSSKSHWDVPVDVRGTPVHILASHPTPPVFDGEEDRNGCRNHDEIRFWADYLEPELAVLLQDDSGRSGGLTYGQPFAILGDLNADPEDGAAQRAAIRRLLDHPFVNSEVVPQSDGARVASLRQRGLNLAHKGDHRADTGDFDDRRVGNLRLDYVLPSHNLRVVGSGVFWPTPDDALYRLVGDGTEVSSSDHRLVYVDVIVPRNAR